MKPRKFIKKLFIISTSVFLAAILGFSIYVGTVPKDRLNTDYLDGMYKTVTVTDIDGGVLDNYYLGRDSAKINLSRLPQHVSDAFISIEDKRFFEHHGFDYVRIGGAIIHNLKSGAFSEGASTISQQLVKNLQLSNEKSVERKIKEAYLTRQLEKRYSKQEILEKYLNIVYFGGGAYGIEAAAHLYFGKGADMLALSEAATLAAVINSPAKYSPIRHPLAARKRRDIVLKQMLDDGKITSAEYGTALEEDIMLNDAPEQRIQAVYMAGMLDQAYEILSLGGEKSLAGYKIETYYDYDKQLALHNAVSASIDGAANEYDRRPSALSTVISNGTLGIEAYYGESAYSLTRLRRQPGSAIKPIMVYAPAIEKNIISPATPIFDEEINYGGYSPRNYSRTHEGWITARRALETSNNIVAVKILDYTGIDYCKNFAARVGIEIAEADNNLSLALGGFSKGVTLNELASSYAALANLGQSGTPSYIRTVTAPDGRVVYRHNNAKFQAMSGDTAYLVTDMLRGTVTSGTAVKLKSLNYDIAAKTGTVGYQKSEKNSDAYCLSYTSDYTVGVWLGCIEMDNEHAMPKNVSGGTYPAQITRSIYKALYDFKPEPFTRPASVHNIDIDALALKNEHKVVRADDDSFARYRTNEVFSERNLPKSKRVSIRNAWQTHFNVSALIRNAG
ncbi:MAG: transglycosylase domain-containing protein [Clostridiales bacterium]|jgi:membrane peptidoglycan carboxypeptidase|nr:transglycosylase domain-containing protein [Clostridiales bacterium]